MSIGPEPLCFHCTHYRGILGPAASDDENITPYGCDAFPKGIPLRFFGRYEKHFTPVEGDNGIVFEDDGTTPDYLL